MNNMATENREDTKIDRQYWWPILPILRGVWSEEDSTASEEEKDRPAPSSDTTC